MSKQHKLTGEKTEQMHREKPKCRLRKTRLPKGDRDAVPRGCCDPRLTFTFTPHEASRSETPPLLSAHTWGSF